MKFRRNIFAAFAAAAMMCSTFSGVCYAADKTETSVTDENNLSEKQINIERISDQLTEYSLYQQIITDDGTIYSLGKKNSKYYLFAIDRDGNITAKTETNACTGVLKQSGDNIIFMWNGYEDPGINIDSSNGWISPTEEQGLAYQMAVKDLYLTVYDKDLNKISENDITKSTKKKSSQYADANSSMLVYTKSGKLYTSDHDEKNKKVILDLADTEYSDCNIAALVVNENYAGLLVTDHSDKNYAAAVDLETGNTKLKKLSEQTIPKAENGIITWTSCKYLDYDAEKIAYNSSEITNIYFKDGKFVTEKIYDKDKFTSILTCTDSSGKTFSQALDKSSNIYTINMTENGKTLKITDIDTEKLFPADAARPNIELKAANGGVIVVRYVWYQDNNYNGVKSDLLFIPYETE